MTFANALSGPPNHDRQCRRFRANLAAGYRRIEIIAAKLVDLLGEDLGFDRGDRTHVDHDLALRKPFGDTVRPEQNGLDVRRIGHHRYDDVGPLSHLLGALAFDAAAFDQVPGRLPPRMQKQLVAGILKMLRHWATHDA